VAYDPRTLLALLTARSESSRLGGRRLSEDLAVRVDEEEAWTMPPHHVGSGDACTKSRAGEGDR